MERKGEKMRKQLLVVAFLIGALFGASAGLYVNQANHIDQLEKAQLLLAGKVGKLLRSEARLVDELQHRKGNSNE